MFNHTMLLMSLYAFFLSYVNGKDYDIPNPEEQEQFFYEEVALKGQSLENVLCNIPLLELGYFCQRLFTEMDTLKYHWKIQLNISAYAVQQQNPSQCIHRSLTFRTTDVIHQYPKDLTQNMVPCYGYHKPIRTNWVDDDYYDLFFASMAPMSTFAYTYRRDLTKNIDLYYIHERFLVSGHYGGRFPQLQITDMDLIFAYTIGTIETRNYVTEHVEAIYVRDMILNNILFQDPLENLNLGQLTTVCLSIFAEEKFQSEDFLIDRQEMLSLGPKRKENTLLFQHFSAYNGHEQVTFLCPGKHASGTITSNMLMLQKWQISSGRKTKSIFIYEGSHLMNAVMPMYYIENFNFDDLKPSLPNETEEYTTPFTAMPPPPSTLPLFV